MKILSGIAVTGLTIAVLMLGSADSFSQGACDRGGNHTIQVRPKNNGMPELKYKGGSADEVHVCAGDTVKWILIGPSRKFFVNFFSSAGAPFAGATKLGSNGNVVKIDIAATAERGGYDYGVNFEDGPDMDPRIVVD